jgi:PAS domain S-box-containing protein
MGRLDNRYFPLLLDVIDQAIFTVDRRMRITSFNRAAEELTGYGGEEVIGSQCSEVFCTKLCADGCPMKRSIDLGQRVIDRRVRVKAKDGRSIPVSVNTAALSTPSGRVLGGVEVMKDLTPLHHLKRQLDGRYRFEDIISKNVAMQRIFDLLPMVAHSNSTVLILGASGTGKELVAKAVHHQSDRRDRPFVALNCAAMPETLMESELFGYVKGAFTDARQDRPGRIAQADGGTLFLDEIGDLSIHLQVKLLRFLQERTYEPLGATFTTRADVRILSATHRDLERMVEEGSFRQDLYYRINIMQIQLPPLCERSEDVPLLLEHFVKRFRHSTGKAIESVAPSAQAALTRYSFPGNVRELENIVERAFILCQGPMISFEHLPSNVRRYAEHHPTAQPAAVNGVAHNPAKDMLGLVERDAISVALRRHHGNRTRAARELGIHRSTLIRKLKRHGLD